jgi:phenylalanyl-tRNA synthetase beta subunit
MKFSYSLIKQFLKNPPSKKEAIDGLNLHSFEAQDLKGDAIDISIPPNRYSDAASAFGIAKELAAIFNLKLIDNFVEIINPPSSQKPRYLPKISSKSF